MIQALLDATPVDSVCHLPSGVIDLPEHTGHTVPRPMTILGHDTTIRVAGVAVPQARLFNIPLAGGRVEVRDLTIEGPDCSSWDSHTESNQAMIHWSLGKSWDGELIVDNVHGSGGYGATITRSGGGRLDITNSTLSGWTDGVAFFESHGGHGTMLMRDVLLPAPVNSKYSSIGAYVHPHIDVLWDNVWGCSWNRYLCYLNGSMAGGSRHELVGVTATNCPLIQSATASMTTLIRCHEHGTPAQMGSTLMGDVLSVGSTWAGRLIGLSTAPAVRRFIGDTINVDTGYFLAAGNNTSGTVELVDCHATLGATGSIIKHVPTSTVATTLTSCTVEGDTRWVVNIEGGTVKFVDMAQPDPIRVVEPGTIT